MLRSTSRSTDAMAAVRMSRRFTGFRRGSADVLFDTSCRVLPFRETSRLTDEGGGAIVVVDYGVQEFL